MNNYFTPLLLLCLFTLLTVSKCKKDVYSPNSDNGLPLPHKKVKIFLATGSNGDANYFERLTLKIHGNLQEGKTYNIDSGGLSSVRLSTNKSCLGYLGSNVINSYSTSGSIQLTKLDSINKIISGTFNCVIPVPDCDSLNITNGRFDITYY